MIAEELSKYLEGILERVDGTRARKKELIDENSSTLSRLEGELSSYSRELQDDARRIIDDYRRDLDLESDVEDIEEASDKISKATMLLSGETKQIVDAFHDVEEVRLEGLDEIYDERDDFEKGGMIKYDITTDDKKVLNLKPEVEAIGPDGTIYLDNISEEDLGKWHTHVKGPEHPSYADLFPMSSMNFEIPHLLISSEGKRLYLPEFLVKLASDSLSERAKPYGVGDRERELRKLGVGERSLNVCEDYMPEDLYYIELD